MNDRTWDTNHAGYRAIFNAALTGILANPGFFGPIMQGDPEAAVAFANRVVVLATTPTATPADAVEASNTGEG